MPQDSNFYRVYKLAYRDRSEFLKSLILVALIISGLSLASLFSLGVLKNFNPSTLLRIGHSAELSRSHGEQSRTINPSTSLRIGHSAELSRSHGEQSRTINFNLLIWAGVLWLISFSLLPIFFLVAPKNQFYFFSLLFCFIPFIPIFLDKAWDTNIFFVIGAILLTNLFAGWRMKAEANILIKLNFPRIISKGIIFLSLALIIILGASIYFERNSLDSARIDINGLINASFSGSFQLGGALDAPRPTLNVGGTIDDILNTYIATQTSELGIIGEPAKKLLLEQTRSSLSQMIGITISGKETIPNLIVNYFKDHWQGMTLQIKLIIYLLFFSFAWSLLILFNYVFSLLVIIVSWLLLKLFLAVKYLQIKRVEVEKEEIALT